MSKTEMPSIRFYGFDDAWEQRKLGEMGQTYTGLSGKTKDDFGHGQARFVTYMNVFSNPISNPEMTEPIEIDPKQNEVEVGDVFFTTSSETPEEVGMSSILLEKRGKTYLNSFCFGFRPSEKIDSYYLAYMLRSESARAKITLLAQGISRYNISKNKVMEIAVSLPSLDEQKMIGQYFSQLDNLITLHQRKFEKLTNVKKSMLEKMFPKDGADVPEVRFKGFTGAWKRKRFSELYESVIQKNDLTYGVDKNITVASMQYRPDIKVTDIEYLRTYNVLKLGDIAFEGHQSKEFRYGRFVENDIGDGIVSHIFAVFRPKTDYDLMFWKYAINNERIMRPVLVRCTKASTMMNDLVSKDFLEESILVPDIEEQKKIGTVLSEIDRLISLQQEELKKLQSFKKALLEKMFV